MARAGKTTYPGAESRLMARVRPQFPSYDVHLVVGDSFERESHQTESYEVIGTSNHAWEFGTWDELLHRASSSGGLRSNDHVLLATSAFESGYKSFHENVNEAAVALLAGRMFALGHMDYYDRPVTALGFTYRHWMRTSLLLIPAGAIEALGQFTTSLPADEELFADDLTWPFRDSHHLDDQWRRYVLDWLTGQRTEQGTTWPQAQTLTHENLDRFRDKAKAILREQMLTRRLELAGFETWDANYLESAPAGSRDLVPWRMQIGLRARDAGLVQSAFAPNLSPPLELERPGTAASRHAALAVHRALETDLIEECFRRIMNLSEFEQHPADVVERLTEELRRSRLERDLARSTVVALQEVQRSLFFDLLKIHQMQRTSLWRRIVGRLRLKFKQTSRIAESGA